MNIVKYQGLFHDGALDHIQISENDITLVLVSAEIDPKEIEDKSLLSQDDRIRGHLTIHGVKSIYLDSKPPVCIFEKPSQEENFDGHKASCKFFQNQNVDKTEFQQFYEKYKLRTCFKQDDDYGEIFDLEITDTAVEIQVSWKSFHNKVQVLPFEVIKIEGKSVSWEPTFDIT